MKTQQRWTTYHIFIICFVFYIYLNCFTLKLVAMKILIHKNRVLTSQPLRSTKTYHRRGMRGIKGPPDIIVTIFITIIILVSVLVSILVLTWLRRLRQLAIWTFRKNLDIWALHYVQNGLLTHWSNVQIWRSKWGWKYKASGLGLKWKEVFSLHNMKSKRCWKYNQNFA